MSFQPFSRAFPERGVRETRYIENRGRVPDLPDGTYDFVEFYCDDPGCDCGVVEIHVFCREEHVPGRAPEDVAVLRWGWTREEDTTPQLIAARSEAAHGLLDVFDELLSDVAYARRLATHYHDFRAQLPKPKVTPAEASRRRRKLGKRRKKKRS